jgi:hypothetical protein
MTDERLEQELRRLPVPPLPETWREEILAAARQVGAASRTKHAEWPPFLLFWRALFSRHLVSTGSLIALWVLILAFKAATPVDPMEKELLARLDPRHPPDFVAMSEQIRLAESLEAWTSEPEPRPRP